MAKLKPPFKKKKYGSVSSEWMILIGLLIIISALVAVFAANIFSQKDIITNKQKKVSLNEKVNPEFKKEGLSPELRSIIYGQEQLKKFTSSQDFREFLEENPLESNGYGYEKIFNQPLRDTRSQNFEEGSSAQLELWGQATTTNSIELSGNDSRSSSGQEPSDYSTTNIQVEGVDEADFVKTDGNYIYVVNGKTIHIINALPADESKIISTITLDSFVKDLYIQDNRIIAFGYDDTFYNNSLYKDFKRHGAYTFFKVYDTQNKNEPTLIKDLKFEGSYFNSRMIGDYVYFITNNYNYSSFEDEPILPRIINNGNIITENTKFADVYYFDFPYRSYNFTTISAINVMNIEDEINKQHYLFDASQNLYASQKNIYLTYTKYVNEDLLAFEVIKDLIFTNLSTRDQKRIAEIENTANYILSQDEKINKLETIFEKYFLNLSKSEQEILEDELEKRMKEKFQSLAKEVEKTIIHKISIDKGGLIYTASASVPGYTLNQFSMDEYNGNIRIATTSGQFVSSITNEESKSKNNLYVLDENLATIGSLEDLAPDERIYSARFMDDRAYLVTFKQVDPFFTIDLSDPREPKVLGALKIPGFSQYLHPYDKEHIIGLGHSTKENEFGGVVTEGVKLALFNVKDVANPIEVDSVVIGGRGSNSEANTDHKAFLFDKEKELLVLPMTLYDVNDDGYWGERNFDGAIVYKVTKDGFEERGRITHENKEDVQRIIKENYYLPAARVRRSLYVNDILYTISQRLMKLNNLSDLKELSTVNFPVPKVDNIIIPFIEEAIDL